MAKKKEDRTSNFRITPIVKTAICENGKYGKKISINKAFVPQNSRSKDEAYRACINNANKNLAVLYDFAEQSNDLICSKANQCINRIYRTDFSGKYSPISINARLDNIMKDFYDWWD